MGQTGEFQPGDCADGQQLSLPADEQLNLGKCIPGGSGRSLRAQPCVLIALYFLRDDCVPQIPQNRKQGIDLYL